MGNYLLKIYTDFKICLYNRNDTKAMRRRFITIRGGKPVAEKKKDIRLVLQEEIFKKKYSEEKVVSILEKQGFKNIVVGKSANGKSEKITMQEQKMTNTLFVNVDKNGYVKNFEFLNEKRDNPSGLAVGIASMLIVITVAVAIIWVAGWVVLNVVDAFNTDDEPSYYDNQDGYDERYDKDFDGDVDQDDAEKYLKDSLEEDKNDGDD